MARLRHRLHGDYNSNNHESHCNHKDAQNDLILFLFTSLSAGPFAFPVGSSTASGVFALLDAAIDVAANHWSVPGSLSRLKYAMLIDNAFVFSDDMTTCAYSQV